jgi:hypothetical protein
VNQRSRRLQTHCATSSSAPHAHPLRLWRRRPATCDGRAQHAQDLASDSGKLLCTYARLANPSLLHRLRALPKEKQRNSRHQRCTACLFVVLISGWCTLLCAGTGRRRSMLLRTQGRRPLHACAACLRRFATAGYGAFLLLPYCRLQKVTQCIDAEALVNGRAATPLSAARCRLS